MLIIKNTKDKGRGVFSRRTFNKNQVVHTCPVIVLDRKDSQVARDTLLNTYLFDWPSENESLDENWSASAVALGFGSLFNHSEKPNMKWEIRREKLEIVFRSIRPIKMNEELVFNYNWDKWNYV